MLSAAQLLSGYARGVFPMAQSAADPQLYWFDPPMQSFIAFCRSKEFEQKAAATPGYDLSAFGKVMFNAG